MIYLVNRYIHGMFDLSFLFMFSDLQEDKEKFEKQLHDMAVVIERLESSRQKLLVEVVIIKSVHFQEMGTRNIDFDTQFPAKLPFEN